VDEGHVRAVVADRPTAMNDMIGKGTPEQRARLTEALLKMKKFDIALLQDAYDGGARIEAAS
jgi:hypothetical protein